jgi:hypothetical protein
MKIFDLCLSEQRGDHEVLHPDFDICILGLELGEGGKSHKA